MLADEGTVHTGEVRSDSDSGAGGAEALASEASAAQAAGGPGEDGRSGEDRPRIADHRDRSQLSAEERALLDRYSRERPPHWD